MKDGKESRTDKNVVTGSHGGRDAVLPLEPDGDIDRDEYDRNQRRLHAIAEQLLTDFRPDHLLVAHGEVLTELRLDRIRDVRARLVRLRLYADQNTRFRRRIARTAAEILKLRLRKSQAVDVVAYLGDFDS